ncbi:MAG: PQQ-dependent sugar dehydrogenase [Chloroflexi bacterium]|nr:PQQ-dependent sugar dehydrogenase [Chloroflexota bacterium]
MTLNFAKKIRKIKRLAGAALLAAFLFGCGVLAPTETPPAAEEFPAASATPGSAEPSPRATLSPTALPSPTATLNPTETPPPTPLSATLLPDPARAAWELVVGDLNKPLGVEHAGDGSGRLFILEQRGVIWIWAAGALLPEPFLDIRDRVDSGGSEQGLLGLAFHPRYAENGYFYVNYTDGRGDTVIACFTVSAGSADLADAGSERRLLTIPQPYPNHNGGAVVFGPDGLLYLGMGDGGPGGDPEGRAQSTQTLLGKILRIDVDGGDPYALPGDNPFVNGGGLGEIWATGLRNPWRMSFDRLSGDLYIADVGQNKWEEINYLAAGSPPGANFGWDVREGAHRFEGLGMGAGLLDPVAEYDHSQGCSVTGGVVYRGAALPDWQGVYLYGDYCSGKVWGLLRTPGGWQDGLLFETGLSIASFGVDENGEVYLVNHRGEVYRLTATP